MSNQGSTVRRRVGATPALPEQNIDTQLERALKDVSLKDYVNALMELVAKDQSIFATIQQVITEKTNEPIVNEATSLSASAAYSPAYAHPSSSSPSFSTPRHNTGYQQQPSYAQTTAYGNIPTGWTIDEPVKRVRHQPPLERQLLPKLPFKDFSQT